MYFDKKGFNRRGALKVDDEGDIEYLKGLKNGL
jgi:hypothetical protein